MPKHKTHARRFIDYFEDALQKNKNDELIVYKKDSYYPCIELEVKMVENVKKDMGILEMTILKLVALGINDVSNIAILLGFDKPKKISSLLDEMHGYSMLELKNKRLHLTQLGKQSLKTGQQMIETANKLLLCGLTGRLLPEKMYAAKRSDYDALKGHRLTKYLINESYSLPLKDLDLQGINKKKYNIKPEVQYISSYDSYTQIVLESQISVVENQDKLALEIFINKELVDWEISNDFMKEIDQEVENLMNYKDFFYEHFAKQGFKDLQIKKLKFKAIEINFSDVNLELLTKPFYQNPFLGFIGVFGTNNKYATPIPINYLIFPSKDDLKDKNIQGGVFYFTTNNIALLEKSAIYKELIDIKFTFYNTEKTQKTQKTQEFNEFFADKTSHINPKILQELIQLLPTHYKNALQKKDENLPTDEQEDPKEDPKELQDPQDLQEDLKVSQNSQDLQEDPQENLQDLQKP